MKKVILTIAMFTALGVNAQLQVKESIKDTTVWRASKLTTVPHLTRFDTEEPSYVFYYQNAKYTTITDINYLTIGNKQTTKDFFDLLLDVVTNDKEYTLDLDGKIWIISKSMGYVSVWSTHTYFYLTRKHIESVIETFKSE